MFQNLLISFISIISAEAFIQEEGPNGIHAPTSYGEVSKIYFVLR